LSLQGESFEWISETEKGGVRSVLCALISQNTLLAIFYASQGAFSCCFIRLSRYE
jgi:hypothetical protein